ncbi:microtubule-associated serine/threonine-protein kinase 2-like isoform X2 [Tachypleus tridentatus]|uniref:microtubule-associated serine/threonine-protein kinase 2-like isoform X2 n=1 Tax=Tachypleus tridentatus TaxID=6853 RepID=UPI003FD19790
MENHKPTLEETVVTLHRGKNGFGLALQQRREDAKGDVDHYDYIVVSVTKGSSAAKAGLKEGLVVTHINGRSLHGKSEFQVFAMINSSEADMEVSILAPCELTNLSQSSEQQKAINHGLKSRLVKLFAPVMQKRDAGLFSTSAKGYEAI